MCEAKTNRGSGLGLPRRLARHHLPAGKQRCCLVTHRGCSCIVHESVHDCIAAILQALRDNASVRLNSCTHPRHVHRTQLLLTGSRRTRGRGFGALPFADGALPLCRGCRLLTCSLALLLARRPGLATKPSQAHRLKGGTAGDEELAVVTDRHVCGASGQEHKDDKRRRQA